MSEGFCPGECDLEAHNTILERWYVASNIVYAVDVCLDMGEFEEKATWCRVVPAVAQY